MTFTIYIGDDNHDQDIASAFERAGVQVIVVCSGTGGFDLAPALLSDFKIVEPNMSYYNWCFGTGYYNFWDYVGAWAAREFQTIQRNHANAAVVRAKARIKFRKPKPKNARTVQRGFKRR